jgi:hypothetical protein
MTLTVTIVIVQNFTFSRSVSSSIPSQHLLIPHFLKDFTVISFLFLNLNHQEVTPAHLLASKMIIFVVAEVLLFWWFGIQFFTSSSSSNHFIMFTEGLFMIL